MPDAAAACTAPSSDSPHGHASKVRMGHRVSLDRAQLRKQKDLIRGQWRNVVDEIGGGQSVPTKNLGKGHGTGPPIIIGEQYRICRQRPGAHRRVPELPDRDRRVPVPDEPTALLVELLGSDGKLTARVIDVVIGEDRYPDACGLFDGPSWRR